MKKEKKSRITREEKKELVEQTLKKNPYVRLVDQIRQNKVAFVVYCVMRVIVIGVIIWCAVQHRWESVFVGVLALILFLLPPLVERTFHLTLPTTLEVLVFAFVFCAEILGEIECYYMRFAFWDTMLHTVNGFMFAAFGFCLVDIFNRNKRFRFELSPIFLSIVAFCFSMTIGILWEFFEFSGDALLATDMQKDFIIRQVSTVALDATNSNTPVVIRDIVSTQIQTANGQVITIEGGYLDIGLIDTMKDLFVNFIGAIVFSVIGYFYVRHKGKGKIANQFIPVVHPAGDNPPTDKEKADKENAEGENTGKNQGNAE